MHDDETAKAIPDANLLGLAYLMEDLARIVRRIDGDAFGKLLERTEEDVANPTGLSGDVALSRHKARALEFQLKILRVASVNLA